ncbi:hypothetical protein RUND412_003378 [Rhizina undulata]
MLFPRLLLLVLLPSSTLSLPSSSSDHQIVLGPITDTHILQDLTATLDTFQSNFFDLSTGTYPTGIDWTSAVLSTILSGTTRSLLSRSPELAEKYFSHLIAFFYGQDVESLKTQAYDDILWVVLNWLEAVNVIDSSPRSETIAEWRAPWSDRARAFYELAERGWDVKLCGGGMVWSPYLEPYKNAITNELFVAASASMFLHHPVPGGGRNGSYLENAESAWRWLEGAGMRNEAGLWTDGFHVGGLNQGGTVCNQRDEMVYTYNQGVLLTGLRGLAEATGNGRYLSEGWKLVSDVMGSEGAVGEIVRNGILTENCDVSGSCSQNAQMFKGIFFHHLTHFCKPLHTPTSESAPKYLHDLPPLPEAIIVQHAANCTQFSAFVRNNANAALSTRNDAGVMGSWWGVPANVAIEEIKEMKISAEAVDYRNVFLPGEESRWGPPPPETCAHEAADVGLVSGDLNDRGRGRTVESHAGGLAAVRAAWVLGVGA